MELRAPGEQLLTAFNHYKASLALVSLNHLSHPQAKALQSSKPELLIDLLPPLILFYNTT